MTGAPTVVGIAARSGVHRPPRSALVAVMCAIALLGAAVGAVWAMITPTVTGRVLSAQYAEIIGGGDSAEYESMAWLAVLLFVFGLVAAVIAWLAARPWRGPVGYLALGVATVAGSVIAAVVGDRLTAWRFDDPKTLPVGTTYEFGAELFAEHWWTLIPSPWVLLICAPFTATLLYLVFALSSADPDLGVGDLPVEAGDLTPAS